jgi:transposase InsO family protein
VAEAVRWESRLTIRRLAEALEEPISTVGRWVKPGEDFQDRPPAKRAGPIAGQAALRERVRALCAEPRHAQFGYRRIGALLRREGWRVNRKTVWRVMRDLGLSRPRVWHRPQRPKRVERMRPERASQAWQIDMTNFQLSTMQVVFLVVIIDCYTRQLVGWTLHRRARASEWMAAVRMALEQRGLAEQKLQGSLTLRSDNGAQPCSKAFVEGLGRHGVRGQYTGYDAPDDNGFVERVIRTMKEEEIWPNAYETFEEAHAAIEAYVNYYNQHRIHSALNYQTPDEFAAATLTLAAA